MKDIAIYGAGGCGKETYLMINRLNKISPQWNIVGFYDRMYEKGYDNGYAKVLGGLDDLNSINQELALVIAMGDSKVTKFIFESINNDKIYYPNIIDVDVFFADMKGTKLGKGNIIGMGSMFSCGVEIGDFNLFNGNVTVGHDVFIGSYNSIMPRTNISGYVKIGEGNLIGVGSIVLQKIKIGNDVHIGAGAVLMTKPKDGSTYLGNPAKLFKY